MLLGRKLMFEVQNQSLISDLKANEAIQQVREGTLVIRSLKFEIWTLKLGFRREVRERVVRERKSFK